LRYQPFVSGGLSTAGVTEGGVASYLNANAAGALVLPATSVHVPETVTAAPSPPPYGELTHDARPEPASEPEKEIESGFVYQPPESGARDGFAAVTWGGVASLRIGTIDVRGGPPNETLHRTSTPAVGVSAEIVVKTQS